MSGGPEGGLGASAHERVRRQHLKERAQDYVEAIYRLERSGTAARVVDLQAVFSVSHVTVLRALEKLEGEGLVGRQPQGLELTAKGRQLAEACFERHELVEAFLRSIGVSAAAASHDAEGIEHHLGGETLEAMRRHLKRG